MAVYTKLTSEQIDTLIADYELGELHSFYGAADGIENSTYFLNLNSNVKLVLTLFESFSPQALPFYIELTSLLHDKGLPVPCPVKDKNGIALQELAGKPALLFPFVVGEHLRQPDLGQISVFATSLGIIHQQCLDLSLEYPEPNDIKWMIDTWEFVKPSLSSEENDLVQEQIKLRREHQALPIPRAVIHADLFRDNVLFHNGEVAGVIDYCNAGFDSLLLDMAIAVNDWCIGSDGLVIEEKRRVFVNAYESQRKLTSLELEHWNVAQQLAATRFWLSRQKATLQQQQGIQLGVKDPLSCKRLLLQHQDTLDKQ